MHCRTFLQWRGRGVFAVSRSSMAGDSAPRKVGAEERCDLGPFLSVPETRHRFRDGPEKMTADSEHSTCC